MVAEVGGGGIGGIEGCIVGGDSGSVCLWHLWNIFGMVHVNVHGRRKILCPSMVNLVGRYYPGGMFYSATAFAFQDQNIGEVAPLIHFQRIPLYLNSEGTHIHIDS